MAPQPQVATRGQVAAVETNKVLRNTYMLLGLTLAFSALTATVSMMLNVPYPGILVAFAGFFGLLFLVEKTADSAWGLLTVFLFTGFMGVILGPVLNFYLQLPNGGSIVASAFGTTAFAFVGLSAFTLITRKDFGFLGSFLAVGFFVLMGSALVIYFFELSYLRAGFAALLMLFASAAILWQTSAIIHGGETNYIRATTTLFVSIYNIFQSLLLLFGMGSDD